jgi:hypothetical protein
MEPEKTTNSISMTTKHFLKENETCKNENMTFLMKILQGLMLKHVYILLILNFPLNMQAAISHLSVK